MAPTAQNTNDFIVTMKFGLCWGGYHRDTFLIDCPLASLIFLLMACSFLPNGSIPYTYRIPCHALYTNIPQIQFIWG